MEFKIEASNRKSQMLLSQVMPSIVEQLGLTKSTRAVLVKVTDDIPDGMEGSAMHIDFADCFMVLIKPVKKATTSALLTQVTSLAHEMVHVRQLARGNLKFLANGKRVWMGKTYSNKTHYLDQPWELDAFARQEIITRRAIEG